ncbi:hypothetical protein JCM10212_005780 [Sporobolomyces blumeae]
MSRPHVVVIGAGVIGLSTAIKLKEAGYRVSLVARDFPGDPKCIEFTSPWAGAHHVSVATGADMRLHQFDARTFQVMSELIEQDPGVPLHFAKQVEYREIPKVEGAAGEVSQLNLISRFQPNFRWLDEADLPEGIAHGATFTCIQIDTPAYLPYLLARFRSKGGKTFRTSTLSSFLSALSADPTLGDAQLVVNCTGLGSLSLTNDDKVFPTRGQLVIVRAPWVKIGMTRLGPNGVYDYTIPRRNGLVVLGGCAEKNNWDPRPRKDMSDRIKTRCLALCPDLLPPEKRNGGTIDDLDVVEEAVGLRPTREGGIRLDVEEMHDGSSGRTIRIVHHYGHGGYGYQSSWGSAEAAVELVDRVLGRRDRYASSQRSARL